MLLGLQEIPEHRLDILFEDESIIVINKPANMLSVKGKPSVPRERRHVEWGNAVTYAASLTGARRSQACTEALQRMLTQKAVPRQEKKLRSWLARVLKVVEPDIQTEVWCAVNEADTHLHRIPLESTPSHRISVMDLVEFSRKTTVYDVHRLDWFDTDLCLFPLFYLSETSGVLLLATDADTCNCLSEQFR